METLFGLFGAGGFGREAMPLAQHEFAMRAESEGRAKLLFVDDALAGQIVNGYPVVSEEQFFSLRGDQRFFNIAIADSKVRERIAEQAIARGAKPITLRADSVIEYDANEIGEGAILCANAIVTSNAKIGRFFHCNLNSYVAHDCIVGDFVTFGPNVSCNGNVHIGNHVYVGTGAIIRDGQAASPIFIGDGAIIGMGAVVLKSVSASLTVIGNPARAIG